MPSCFELIQLLSTPNRKFLLPVTNIRYDWCRNKTQGRTQGGGGGGGVSRGAHLKKLRRAEGGAKIFGVIRVKNHDFTTKKSYFSNFRGGRAKFLGYFMWKITILRQQNHIFSIFNERQKNCTENTKILILLKYYHSFKWHRPMNFYNILICACVLS
jgi:hypothetical protein